MTDTAHGPTPDPGSLLDWFAHLVSDAGARARLAADPGAVLAEHGLADLDPADVHHVIGLVADTVAARVDATFDPSAPAPAPDLLEGETALEATARQITYLSDQVRFEDADPDRTEVLRDELAGAPDGVEGFASPSGPGDVPAGFDDPDDHGLDDLAGPHHVPDPTDPVDSAVSVDMPDLVDDPVPGAGPQAAPSTDAFGRGTDAPSPSRGPDHDEPGHDLDPDHVDLGEDVELGQAPGVDVDPDDVAVDERADPVDAPGDHHLDDTHDQSIA